MGALPPGGEPSDDDSSREEGGGGASSSGELRLPWSPRGAWSRERDGEMLGVARPHWEKPRTELDMVGSRRRADERLV